jgi:hypothetical protein
VLVANERQDRLADVAALVASLGHEVIAPQRGQRGWTSNGARTAGCCVRRSRCELAACARADRADRPRGRLPGCRASARAGPRVRDRGRATRGLRLHH